MGLLTALILENEGFSLNDLSMIQRVALKKAYTGRLNPDEVSERESTVLDSLVDLGLLDMGYDVTEDGANASKLMDTYSKGERDDLAAAKQLRAEQEDDERKRTRREQPPRENFRFSEGEEAVMKAAGLNPKEMMEIFLGENMLGGLTHYVIDPRNKEMVTAFELGKCENCKGDVQEVNAINIDPEGAKRLRLKKMDYLPAEVSVIEDGDGSTCCDNCYDEAVAGATAADEVEDDIDGEFDYNADDAGESDAAFPTDNDVDGASDNEWGNIDYNKW